jgi:protein gp37
MAKRLKAMGQSDYQTDGDPKTSGPGFGIAAHPHRLDLPLTWKKPRKVFVNSMSDLFHDGVPTDHIAQVFAVMSKAPQHTFQILTKRHGRMRSLLKAHLFKVLVDEHRGAAAGDFTWPLPNVWLGVSVENQKWADIRIPALLDTPAAVRFLSCEPLLGPVSLFANSKIDTGTLVDWVIVGGESGRNARPMHPAWARHLRYECNTYGIPFHFKQHGEWSPAPWKPARLDGEAADQYKVRAEAEGATHAVNTTGFSLQLDHKPWSVERNDEAPTPWQGIRKVGKKAAGRELDGRTWDEYPQPANA